VRRRRDRSPAAHHAAAVVDRFGRCMNSWPDLTSITVYVPVTGSSLSRDVVSRIFSNNHYYCRDPVVQRRLTISAVSEWISDSAAI